jgi:hypothetical protein
MIEEMDLLRAVAGTREGWRCRALEEFLRRLDPLIDAWKEGQLLIGTVLPRLRESQPDPSHGRARTAA